MVDYFYESLSRPLSDRRSTKRLRKPLLQRERSSTTYRLLHFRSFPFSHALVSLVTRGASEAQRRPLGVRKGTGASLRYPPCLSLYRFFHFYIVISIYRNVTQRRLRRWPLMRRRIIIVLFWFFYWINVNTPKALTHMYLDIISSRSFTWSYLLSSYAIYVNCVVELVKILFLFRMCRRINPSIESILF